MKYRLVIFLLAVNNSRHSGEKMNGVRAPQKGEKIHMVCTSCGYKGMGKVPGTGIFGQTPATKCPSCKQKTFVKDPTVQY